MFSLFAILLPILATDIVNPVLAAAVIFALGSRRPFINAVAVLFGWLIVYYVSGIIIALGLDAITGYLENPHTADFIIEIVVGVLLLWLGIRVARGGDAKKKKDPEGDSDNLTTAAAFGMGAAINLIGMPFAVPYFAVLDQILKADLSWIPSLTVLLVYNVLYILPFSLLILIRVFNREGSDAIFAKINARMESVGNVIMPALLLLIGAALLADAVTYFVRGRALF